MNKKILAIAVISVLVIVMGAMFVACDTGTYTYTAPTGDVSTVKLGMGGKVTVDFNLVGLKVAGEGEYTIEKADEKGNKVVKLTIKDEKGNAASIPAAYLNKDGNLVVGLFTFKK